MQVLFVHMRPLREHQNGVSFPSQLWIQMFHIESLSRRTGPRNNWYKQQLSPKESHQEGHLATRAADCTNWAWVMHKGCAL